MPLRRCLAERVEDGWRVEDRDRGLIMRSGERPFGRLKCLVVLEAGVGGVPPLCKTYLALPGTYLSKKVCRSVWNNS